jgi:hypothetical protein
MQLQRDIFADRSVYEFPESGKVWVTTEASRSSTIFLSPRED